MGSCDHFISFDYTQANWRRTGWHYATCNNCHVQYSWWSHQMETFSLLLALCGGMHRSPVDSPTKASDAELWCFLWSPHEKMFQQTIEKLVIWDHRAHYNGTVMCIAQSVVRSSPEFKTEQVTHGNNAWRSFFDRHLWAHGRYKIYCE